MRRPGYREAVLWIADNDDTEWAGFSPDDACGSPSVTACLIADLFGVDVERVRKDINRELNQERLK